jgi:hypothetical protein
LARVAHFEQLSRVFGDIDTYKNAFNLKPQSKQNAMQMYNFDFMDKNKSHRIETRNYMMRSLREARNRCESLFETYGRQIGANSVRLRENGKASILYEWPEA